MAPSRASAVREGGGEASVGVHAGEGMEPKLMEFGVPTPWGGCGRQDRGQRYARAVSGPRAVEEPKHVWSLRAREPGDLMAARLGDGRAGRSGKAEAVRLRCTVMRSRTGR